MKKEKWMKFYNKIGAGILTFFLGCVCFALPAEAADFRYPLDEDGELIVVLDPGHGGENLGADYNGYVEKDMNMIVTNAMYEELSKYEGITVYMTHTEDVDMSLKERARFARDVNADYLFCLHFNMSANNNFYGAEVWVESKGDENREGYAFASVQLKEMADMGLFIRGAKTRIGENGNDYYGILRHCKEYGIAAALIEHCHVDNEKDTPFCDSREDLEAFGRADATAVAKYFGLSSRELSVDYSDYVIPAEIEADKEYLFHDITEPEVSLLHLEECDYEKRTVSLHFKATDSDTPMLYYSYSVDGGETFSECFPWPEADMMAGSSPESFRFTIDIAPGTTPVIVARAYNKYDRYTDSNVLTGFSAFPLEESPETAVNGDEETQETEPGSGDDAESGNGLTGEKGDVPVGSELSGEPGRKGFWAKLTAFASENKLLTGLGIGLFAVFMLLICFSVKGRKRNKRQ